MNNPQTGIAIELPGKAVGKIQVSSLIAGDVTSELATCTKTTGEIPVDNFLEFYVEEK